MVLDFVDDNEITNASYLAWVQANPDGFVLNVPRQTDTILLHSAGCCSIKRDNERYVGPDYYKKCSAHKHELVEWANQQPKKWHKCHLSHCKQVMADD